MFDWVSDAISWIGDAVASAWESTAILTIDDITGAVFEAMFQWVFGLIYGAIAEIFEFINSTSASGEPPQADACRARPADGLD